MEATKPQALTSYINIPQELKALPQWVLWRYEERNGKKTKVPYQVSGQKAESNDPSTWAAFDRVLAAMPNYDGVGVMFGNGLAGVDLDHHIDAQGQLSPFAKDIITRLDSYTELSPSGMGIHILYFGTLPPGRRRKDEHGIEMYSAGRFFTVTGNHLAGTPSTVNNRTKEITQLHREIFGEYTAPAPRKPSEPNSLDDAALIEKARNANNGGKFAALWAGDCRDYNSDRSRADLALCSTLAFWTGGDTGRIDRLFRSSGLMRDKWDERHSGSGATYGEMTIEKSLQGVDFYSPTPRANGNGSATPAEPYYPADWDAFVQPPAEEIITPPTPTPQDKPAAERFRIHTAAEALEPLEPIKWRVKDLIEAGSVVAFIGDAGSGKTYMLLDMAVAIANGEPYWGDFEINNHCPVLIIDEESGDRRMKRRLSYVMKAHNAGPDLPLYYVSLARFDIRNPEDINTLQMLIEQTKAGLVIIDAFMDVIPGADENSSKDMQPGLLALGLLAKTTDASVLPIHHTNKAGGYRGSTAIKGSVDGMYIIEKAADSSVVEVKTEKARDTKGARFTMIAHFHSNPITGELEKVYFSPADPKEKKPTFSKSEKYVIRYLEEHKEAEITAIKEAADTCSDEAARQAVYSLTDKGYTYRTNEGSAGKKATYSLTEKGRQL